jgi:hypothetical protein
VGCVCLFGEYICVGMGPREGRRGGGGAGRGAGRMLVAAAGLVCTVPEGRMGAVDLNPPDGTAVRGAP